MKTYKYNGIVIKRKNFGEADKIIVFFTAEKGKIKAIGKGIRKIISRRAPHLEIFSQVNVHLHEGTNFPYITESQLIHGFTKIRQNLRKILIAYHLCEIIDKITPEGEKNRYLYETFLKTLLVIEEEKNFARIRQVVHNFVHDLLLNLGYLKKEKKAIRYSQLLLEIENTIEKPLSTVKLLTRLKKDLNNNYLAKQ